MTQPDQQPQEPTVVPGYFSPADAPHQPYQPQQYQGPGYQGRQMPAPVNPYVAPSLQYGPGSALSLPLYSASPVKAVTRFFKKYGVFSGRASRSEFWLVQLFMFFTFMATALLASGTGDWIITVYMLFMLGCLVPGLALTSRRLHDANLHGGLTALVLVPYVGVLVVAILAMLPSKESGRQFDKNQGASVPFGQQR